MTPAEIVALLLGGAGALISSLAGLSLKMLFRRLDGIEKTLERVVTDVSDKRERLARVEERLDSVTDRVHDMTTQ